MMRKYSHRIYFVFILAFIIFSRFFLLDKIPATITHDEIQYAVQSYSYVNQGADLSQRYKPWTLETTDPLYAEWPAMIISPGFLLFKNVLLATHFMPAVIGTLFPIVFGWLLYGIWKKRDVFLAGMTIAAFNPLLVIFSRLGYDGLFSLFFYFLGLGILFNLKKWYRLLSIPFLIIGFFEYQGFKLLLFPALVIFTLLNISVNNDLSDIKDYLKIPKLLDKVIVSVLAFSIILTLFYGLVILPGQDHVSDRLGHTILTDSVYSQKIVSWERFLTLDSPLKGVFSNRITVIAGFMGERLINTYNPYFLFVADEPGMPLFLWSHGLFYFIEGLFMAAGFYFVFSKKSKITGIILITSLIILDLPNLINNVSAWFTNRGMFAYVMLLIVGALGLAQVWKNKRMRPLIVLIYFISIIGFSYQYFFRYPVITLDAGNYDERVLSHYLLKAHEKNPDIHIEVIVEQPEYRYSSYIVYAKALKNENKKEISNAIKAHNGKYTVDNITFSNECPQPRDESGKTIYIQGGIGKCFDSGPNAIHIVALKDSGFRYTIGDDRLCRGIDHSTFINIQTLKQLDVEKMTNEEFCRTTLTKLAK